MVVLFFALNLLNLYTQNQSASWSQGGPAVWPRCASRLLSLRRVPSRLEQRTRQLSFRSLAKCLDAFFHIGPFSFFFFLIILSCPTGFSHCLHLDLWTLETLLWGDCQAPVMRLCLEQLPSNLRGAAAPGRGGPQLSSVSFQEGGHTSFYFQAVTQSLVIYLSKSPTCIFGPWDPGVFPPSGLHRCWTQSPMPVVSASLPTLGFHSVSRPHRCSPCF